MIKKKKLSDRIVDEIREKINSGELNIGDKLPNQNQLSQDLGVSRTSLREAMNILAILGVIEQRPGFGTVIRKKIPEINLDGLKPKLLTDDKTTRELLEARQIIETGTARLTALNATVAQVNVLQDMVSKMQALLENKDYKGYSQIDLSFHRKIAEISNNRFLREAFVTIQQHMQLFITEHTHLRYNVLEESQKHHHAICKAIENQDPGTAAREMENHIIFLIGSFQSFKENSSAK